jgi:hypothetical protein
MEEPPIAKPRAWASAHLVVLAVFFPRAFRAHGVSGTFNLPPDPNAATQNTFVRSVNALSILAIPFLLSFFPVYAATRGIKVYEEFVEGAKEGFGVILKSFRSLLPCWWRSACLRAQAESNSSRTY